MSNEREAFEVWAVQEARRMKYSFPEDAVQINGLGDYAIVWVQGAWLGHQAGAEWQRSQQSAPAGYVMVPVEPTPEMLDCIMDWQKIGNVTAYRAMLASAPKAEQPPVQEPVYQIHQPVDVWKRHWFGVDVYKEDYDALEDAAPQPVSDDALMSAVEDVIDHLNGGFSIHSGQGLHSCLEAAYRAAMGSKGDE